jgi:hypothetical protein
MRPHLRNAFDVLQRRHEVGTGGLRSADHHDGCGTMVDPIAIDACAQVISAMGADSATPKKEVRHTLLDSANPYEGARNICYAGRPHLLLTAAPTACHIPQCG